MRRGDGARDCHRRHDAARRRRGGDDRARRRARRRAADRARRQRRQRRVVRRHRHHGRRNRAARRAAADQPRHRRAGRDRRRRRCSVWRRPVVAILSTGDEIIAPGEPMGPARVYDSNAQVLADAVRELGGEPRRLGIAPDDAGPLRAAPARRRSRSPTSCCCRAAPARAQATCRIASSRELDDPGIVAHGVALKPGKPICLAATGGRAGRRPARVSHVGDLHVPRVRRAGHPPAGRPRRRSSARPCRPGWR